MPRTFCGQQTQSGMKSRFPRARPNFNELHFEDKKDARIYFHAEKDYRVVGNNTR